MIAERNSSICVCNEGVRQSLEFALPDHVYRCAVRDIRCLPCDTSDVGLDAVYSLALIVVIFAFPTIFMSLRVEDHWRYHIPAVVSCLWYVSFVGSVSVLFWHRLAVKMLLLFVHGWPANYVCF